MIHDIQSAQISQKKDGRNIYVIMKTMCPSGYHRNGIVATHALGHMMYNYKLLVPINQRVLNKQNKVRNISGHKWYATHRVLKSHRRKMGVIYLQSWKKFAFLVITTIALRQLMHLGTWCTFGHTLLLPMNQRVLNKQNKERNISGYKWSTTHRVLKSHRTKMSGIHM